ncbi:MAG: hypothetical protein ACTSRR_05875 [Candidatus Heimdallarchaeaceae archaeon]
MPEIEQSFKKLLNKITQILDKNMKDIEFPHKQSNKLHGEIIQQTNRILNNEEPEEVWKDYIDFFVEEQIVRIIDIKGYFKHSKDKYIKKIRKLIEDFCNKHNVKQTDIEFFVISYLELIEPFKDNQECYEHIWSHLYSILQLEQKESEFKLPSSLHSDLRMLIDLAYSYFLPYSLEFKTTIIVPLHNFLLKDETKVNHENKTIRLSSKYQGEQYYVLYQDIRDVGIPQYTKDGHKRFKIDGITSVIGGFSPYVFELTYEIDAKTMIEYSMFFASLPPDCLDDNNYLTIQGLNLLKTLNNNHAQYLVDKGLEIEKYLELALKLFKEGDVRIYGKYEKRYPTRDIYNHKLLNDEPYYLLEKKQLPNYENPYILNKKECEEFFYFWEIFYNKIRDLEHLDTALVSFYDSEDKGDDDEYLGYYRCVEILLTKPEESRYGKWNRIKERIRSLFKDGENSDAIIEVIDKLRDLRNIVGHQAFINSLELNKLKDSLQIFLKQNIDNKSIKIEIKKLLMSIFREYWENLKACNYNEDELLTKLYSR